MSVSKKNSDSVSVSVNKKTLALTLALTLMLSVVVHGEEGKDVQVPIEMILVKGGCFEMGDVSGDGENDEVPVHEVCVDDFYIGKYEVTIGEFGKFVNESGYISDAEKMGGCFGKVGYKWRKRRDFNWSKVDFPQTDRHPAVCISYNDANEFIKWLNEKLVVSRSPERSEGEANPSNSKYRLPTEAEWEYAARSGGKVEKWAGTNNESEVSDYAWYVKNSGGKTHPVGQKKPNGLGIYDMSGNVWEWVEDWYEVDYYDRTTKINPLNTSPSHAKSMRGGPWSAPLHAVRVFYRGSDIPYSICDGLGFRIAKIP